MGKKSKSKAGGDFWDEDPELDTTATEELGTSSKDTKDNEGEEQSGTSTPAEPSVATGDDLANEFDGGLMSAIRKSKSKKVGKAEAAAAEVAAAQQAAADNLLQVKSKKEKEKEKKEKEKLRKKQQAERKKAATKEAKAEPAAVSSTVEATTLDASKDTDGSTAKGGKPKKKNAVVAALQKQLAAQKELEVAQQEAEEEERKRLEEEEKLVREEEQKKEEARQKKKEKEKQKREELKAQGKLLTKKQKEQLQIQQRRRQQLLESGVVVEGLNQDGEKTRPKKVVYGKPKKTESKKEEEHEVEKQPKELQKEPIAEKTPEPEPADKESPPEEDLLDDWEAAIDSDGDVKDSWESLAEEEEKKVKKPEEKTDKKSEKKHKVDVESKKAKEIKVPSSNAPISSEVSSPTASETSQSEPASTTVTKAKEASSGKKRHIGSSSSSGNLRSPICCILGHVDTGKTKLLDKVRQTNVQEGEAGGITQQIGATYFPIEAIRQKTSVMEKYVSLDYNVPGLLIIDTPGHESFSNLRSRGSSLCNIAILVIDIMHGLEPQTLESIKLLRDRKTPFVVALNKIDRLYDWEVIPNNSFRDSFSKQKSSVQREFQDRFEKIKVELAEQGLNSELYFQNKNISKFVSIVPTSAVTGEGVPDLLYLLLELTQSRMSKQLMYLSHLEATILEVKVVEGLGTTIDVILSNGVLREGDRIVLCGQNGPIATNVRALLTPQPLRELRIKSAYVHHKEVKAALGVKIAANDLDKAVAGSRLLLVGPDDDEEELMDDVMDDLTGLLDSVDKSGRGVCVQASTLGSLEALLDFLKDMKIPVMAISIGPVFKRDVIRASSMLERAPELALMLCFDVKIDKEAEQYAAEQGIKIFSANIIYHLFDAFIDYQKKLLEQKRKDNVDQAIFPCVLKTIQIINKRNPMIIGVDVTDGSLRVGTPIAVVKSDPNTGEKLILPLGRVASLEVNHKSVDIVRKGTANAGVAMRLADPSGSQPTWGRHIDENDNMFSHITRASIDTLKDPAFRDSVPREDWLLIKTLKPVFDIK